MNREKIKFTKNKPFSIRIQAISKYPIHWHEDITEILLPIKGSIEVISNFEHVLVKEGDFWFVNNKSIHSIRSPSKSIVVFFHIDLNYFENQFEHIKYMFFRNNMYSNGNIKIESDNLNNPIKRGYKTRFRNLLISTLTNIINNTPLTKDLTKDLICQLINSMVQEFNWLQFIKKDNTLISSLQLNRYYRVIKFIDEHYPEKITLDDIASQEFITKNYFSHFWKNLSCFSFNEYLNYKRVLKSEFLLLTTDMSISSIAQKCGFSDVKYYYKHFKRWYGCTPSEHRNKCFSYMNKKFDYNELKLINIAKEIDSYIKNIILTEYTQDNIWNTTSLFDNYIKMKYLYKINKMPSQRSTRNIIVDVLNPNNFKIKGNKSFFNWQNIDLSVNFSETSNSTINIKFNCHYLKEKCFEDIIYKFLNSCIHRYRIITVEKWKFFILYNDTISFNYANTIGNIISKKIQHADVSYFFEV
ncbi:helix-turn-helix domain-containing protein [Schnuerera sp. xch1]|uniref:AraC family transcriptional regulator n=1 Tax=Schnuerera sp. xch1 TaxID=2874283 RepID=UPI001CC04F00|nr:helix-turn-helix domain-containing protein [Schnuerera sp. xch1]MBZ2175085.1 helix-turn-helix domain-containing protein [Schnuerera sp. xch1]